MNIIRFTSEEFLLIKEDGTVLSINTVETMAGGYMGGTMIPKNEISSSKK